jgi:hypothetical protein
MERALVHEETSRHPSHLRKRDHDHGQSNGHKEQDKCTHNAKDDQSIKNKEEPIKKSEKFWSRDYDLLHFNHLPEMFKHNPFILDHYRPHLDSWKAFKSIFHLHNGKSIFMHNSVFG